MPPVPPSRDPRTTLPDCSRRSPLRGCSGLCGAAKSRRPQICLLALANCRSARSHASHMDKSRRLVFGRHHSRSRPLDLQRPLRLRLAFSNCWHPGAAPPGCSTTGSAPGGPVRRPSPIARRIARTTSPRLGSSPVRAAARQVVILVGRKNDEPNPYTNSGATEHPHPPGSGRDSSAANWGLVYTSGVSSAMRLWCFSKE